MNIKSRAPIRDILKSIDAYQPNTNTVQQEKEFSTFRDHTNLRENYNFQADHITLPTDRFGYSHLLVVVDIAKKSFDIEAQKTESSTETLKAMKKIFSRGILSKPEASISTDGASSFKGDMADYMYHQNIFHKVESKGRHTQLAIVNNLIRQLSKIFNALMNKQELKTGKISKAWVKYVPLVREKVNESMQVELPDDPFYDMSQKPVSLLEHATVTKDGKVKLPKAKFKVGDRVHILLTEPENALGKKQKFGFRSGDFRFSKKVYIIENVYTYAGKILYRYKVTGISNVSYTERQLRKVKN